MNQKHRIPKNHHWFSDLLFISIALGIFYAIWIGSYPLNTPDEGRYSEVAREMVITGDYITPRLNGVAFLDKPILYYWLQASAIKIFGLKEAALRFWPAFLGVLSCMMVYISGVQLFNRRTGILSAIILATSPLYYSGSHYANLDLEVAALICNSLLFFILGVQPNLSKRSRFGLLLGAYVFAALATLTKGLIGFVFPIMIMGTWILILNRWSILLKMHLISGLIIFLLIAAPWFLLVQKANPQFFDFFFVTQQLSRFLTKGDFNNKSVIWFYIPIVLAAFIPWSVFLIQAIAHHIKLVWKNRQQHSTELFILLWFSLILMFFSIPKSKTIGYIMPVFPAIALLVGNYLSTFWNHLKTKGLYFGLWLYVGLCLALAVGYFFARRHNLTQDISEELFIYLNLFVSIFLLSATVVTFYLIRKTAFSKIFYCLLATAVIFLLSLIHSAAAINQKSIKPLATIIKTESSPDDEIVTYFKYYQDLPIYLERRITVVADWHDPDIIKFDNWQRELWFNMPYQNTSAWLIESPDFWQRWASNKRLFVLVDKRFYSDFNNTKNYKLAETNDIILISNQLS